jgi:ABC-2 type transport system permease protein
VKLAPGSTLWLVAHELRLDWRRRIQPRPGRRAALWLTAGFPLFLMLVSVPLGRALRHYQVTVEPVSAMVACAGLAGYFTLMLSQTLGAAVDMLYERGDLDLMLASPIAPRRVLMVRCVAIAFRAFSVFGFFTVPPLVVIAWIGHPEWLAAIGVIFALALAAAGLGLLLASDLLRMLGARRTRTVAHVLAAVIGAFFFLLTQVRSILGGEQAASLSQEIARIARSPDFHPPPGFDWPLRAMIGEPLPLLALLAICSGLFLLATAWLGPRFAADMAQAAGAAAPRRRTAAPRAFIAGAFPATLQKELRLIARDPTLLLQVLVRVLYLLPLGFIALRNTHGQDSLALAGAAAALTFMANQVAGSLAWITISAEEAPEVLASAPAPISLIRRAKMAAVILVVSGLLAPVLLPLIVLAPVAGLAASAGCAAAMLSAVLLNTWWQRPAKRSEFRNRRNTSWFVTVAELGLGLLIGGATGLFAAGQPWGLFPAFLAAGTLLALRRDEPHIELDLRSA